jgi:hypothetical protein
VPLTIYHYRFTDDCSDVKDHVEVLIRPRNGQLIVDDYAFSTPDCYLGPIVDGLFRHECS